MMPRRTIVNEVPMFITTNVKKRRPFFARDGFAKEAIDHLYRVQLFHPFFIYGFVIMPDHCHFLLKVCAPETICRIMDIYKGGLAHQIGIGPIWQPRYHLEFIYNLPGALNYIHMNPVKGGLCKKPEDYPWSSASGKWDVTSFDEFSWL